MGSKNLILIDGHALAFREYYALERTGMKTATGTPTWAVYGFFKAIFDLLKNENLNPDAIAVTFDVSHHTFRTEAYTEYKANREKMPDEMQIQMGLIYEGLKAFNIPIYQKEGFEADDVIGTISKKACELGHKVLILTGDQDSFQLVDEAGCVKVILPYKGELLEYTWDKVYEKWGVYPSQVIDYKALRGDTSDNIPGIKGIGEKTAQKLLERFGNLDNIYAKVEEIKEKSVKEKIINGKDSAYMSQHLATIIRDVDIDFDFDKACIALPDVNEVTDFLTKMQFYTFIKNIKTILSHFNKTGSPCVEAQVLPKIKIEEKKLSEDLVIDKNVPSDSEISEILEKIKSNGFFFFDLSIDFQNVLKQNIFEISLGVCEGKKLENNRYEFVIDKENLANTYRIDGSKLQLLKSVFEDKTLAKFTVDCKRDFSALMANCIELKNVVFDATLASYVENSTNSHAIEIQALQCLNISNLETPNAPMQLGLLGLDTAENRVNNVWLSIQLAIFRMSKMNDTNWNLMSELEIPLAQILAEMEFSGVYVEREALKDFTETINETLKDLENKIFSLAGVEFNINSPKQVGQILFDKLGIKRKKRTKTKNYSTSIEVLEELAEDYEIASHLISYRKYAKLKSTYTEALPQLINPADKRIHTTYNQTVTATGRLSSSNPNLQNIPSRTVEGEKIKRAFVAEGEDKILISADYSQIELRLLAHISQDKNLINAYQTGEDIHAMTASSMYNVPLNEVTKQMRTSAKAINFGIVYGQSRFGLAKAMGVSNEEAQGFINSYFLMFPGVKEYMITIVEKVTRLGYVETIYGRKRFFQGEIDSSNASVREFAKRASINFPMQGSASDLMKLAMIKFYKELKKRGLKSKLILQVHDEMVVEALKSEAEEIKQLLIDSMEIKNTLAVPLLVNVKEGVSWA